MARVPTGTEIIVGMKKGATWGTPVVLGAGDGVYLLDEGVESAPEILMDESMGNAFTKCFDLGNIVSEGDINALVKYEGLLLPFALCLGTAGVPSLLTDGYEHILQCADNVEGLFATFAVDKIQKVHENPSVKIAGFTISGESGGYVKVTFNLIANSLETESVTNTLVTMQTVTYLLDCGNIVFNNGLFLLKDQGGAAPADPGDRVYPSAFEIVFNRNASGDFVANGTREIIEPQQDGVPEVTASLTFPRYTDTRFIEDLFAMQEHEMIVNFTGGKVVPPAGTDDYEFYLELPRMIIDTANTPAGGQGKMPNTITYKLGEAAAIPTGFDNAKPLTVGFINTVTTDPLA